MADLSFFDGQLRRRSKSFTIFQLFLTTAAYSIFYYFFFLPALYIIKIIAYKTGFIFFLDFSLNNLWFDYI